MNDLPETSEGRLIRTARELAVPKLTIRAAAVRIGMSAEQWGYAERGHLPRRGSRPPQEFHPPAPTLAKMARAVGVTPAELTGAGREDAARALEAMQRRGPVTPVREPLPPVLRVPDESALEPYMESVYRDVWRAIGQDPGRSAPPISDAMLEQIDAAMTAADLFGPQHERDAWAITGYTPWQRLRLVAIFRQLHAVALGETGQADAAVLPDAAGGL